MKLSKNTQNLLLLGGVIVLGAMAWKKFGNGMGRKPVAAAPPVKKVEETPKASTAGETVKPSSFRFA